MTEETTANPVPPSKEERQQAIIEQLQSTLKETQAKFNEASSKSQQLQQALNISKLQLQQYAGNISVLKTQRDAFLDELTDSGVNIHILKEDSANQLEELRASMAESAEQVGHSAASFNQQQAALDEVREKFGITKHAQKRAEKALQESRDLICEMGEAFEWYYQRAAKSVPENFLRRTKRVLSLEIIAHAYSLDNSLNITNKELLDYLCNNIPS